MSKQPDQQIPTLSEQSGATLRQPHTDLTYSPVQRLPANPHFFMYCMENMKIGAVNYCDTFKYKYKNTLYEAKMEFA